MLALKLETKIFWWVLLSLAQPTLIDLLRGAESQCRNRKQKSMMDGQGKTFGKGVWDESSRQGGKGLEQELLVTTNVSDEMRSKCTKIEQVAGHC